jgi:hypothetical protein
MRLARGALSLLNKVVGYSECVRRNCERRVHDRQ